MRPDSRPPFDFALYPSPLGYIRIFYDEGYIRAVQNIAHTHPAYEAETQNKGSPSVLSDKAYGQLAEYFEGKRAVFDFPFYAEGTAFQKRVWEALCTIPYGEVCTYKDIAVKIGNPASCRAVGGANNKNPIAIVVPCHRVIGADGSLTGYASGLDVKKALLDLEQRYRHVFMLP